MPHYEIWHLWLKLVLDTFMHLLYLFMQKGVQNVTMWLNDPFVQGDGIRRDNYSMLKTWKNNWVLQLRCIAFFSMCLKQLSALEKDLESLVHRPLRLCTLTSLKLTSALRWILNTKIMENNLRLLYVIMIPFMFVTTRTISLHKSCVLFFRWNILQVIFMQKLICIYLT